MPDKKHLIILGLAAVAAYLYSQSSATGATTGINNWPGFMSAYNAGYSAGGGK